VAPRHVRNGSAARYLAAAILGCLLTACVNARQETTSPSPARTGSTPRSVPSPTPTAVPDIRLEVVADGLVAPVSLVSPPDRSDRSFVVDQTGLVLTIKEGKLLPEPFLDLTRNVIALSPDYDERGLLGLAFHPDFAENGRFFVYYSAAPGNAGADHDDVLSEFRAAPGRDRADPASEKIILRFGQPQPNHSGGALGFGPDGLLYLGTGDGGGRGDADEGHSEQGNAQDPSRFNGKILRVDVDGDRPYAIPPDNPFVGGGGRPEIFALGFRNPWRLSWEPAGKRRLLVSDVGFGRYEELDVVELGGNYGWRVREGRHCLDVKVPLNDLATCPLQDERGQPLIDPVLEYSHREIGLAIVGGYVYRGSNIPALRGRYVFGDWSADWKSNAPTPRGSLLVTDPGATEAASWTFERLTMPAPLDQFVTGMGEDRDGELYVMTREEMGPTGDTGAVHRIVPGG
jgi:glucose/arabinose dehydrogenase